MAAHAGGAVAELEPVGLTPFSLTVICLTPIRG
jgi:hypothetical protein